MQYYHLSLTKLKRNVMFPRIPKRRLEYEDNKIKRVCFSTSICGCVRGSGYCFYGRYFYVYVPCDYSGRIIKPTERQLPDVKCSREKWFIDKVRVKCIGKVKIISRREMYYSDFYNDFGFDYKLEHRWVEKIFDYGI